MIIHFRQRHFLTSSLTVSSWGKISMWEEWEVIWRVRETSCNTYYKTANFYWTPQQTSNPTWPPEHLDTSQTHCCRRDWTVHRSPTRHITSRHVTDETKRFIVHKALEAGGGDTFHRAKLGRTNKERTWMNDPRSQHRTGHQHVTSRHSVCTSG